VADVPAFTWEPPRERCEECGFEYETVSPADAAVALRSFGKRYRAPLTRFLSGEDGDALLRERPSPGAWSALEYAAHARDAIRFNTYLARRALSEDNPELPFPNPDKIVAEERYNTQLDPATVADELAERGERCAQVIESADADAWSRTATFGSAGSFTALWFARNAVHEGHHHLLDVGRTLRHVREAANA
jgi:DinB family protein